MLIHEALAAAHEQAVDRLSGLERRAADLQRELNQARTEVEGLRLAMEHHRPAPVRSQRAPQIDVDGDDWTALSKTDAVARCLAEADVPLSPGEIVTRLAAAGRTEDNDQVRAGLAYLKRLGRAQLLRRGQWVADLAAVLREGQASILVGSAYPLDLDPPPSNGTGTDAWKEDGG